MLNRHSTRLAKNNTTRNTILIRREILSICISKLCEGLFVWTWLSDKLTQRLNLAHTHTLTTSSVKPSRSLATLIVARSVLRTRMLVFVNACTVCVRIGTVISYIFLKWTDAIACARFHSERIKVSQISTALNKIIGWDEYSPEVSKRVRIISRT